MALLSTALLSPAANQGHSSRIASSPASQGLPPHNQFNKATCSLENKVKPYAMFCFFFLKKKILMYIFMLIIIIIFVFQKKQVGLAMK